ncbi:membrane fusion protein, adhesin transport system [Cognatiyoonia sediminum]|uniref:Membrane fusion protein (MFP) family protein n=1 Tax=Cognatiyoonia sediminum TaxID=1508389 RepID=A0A1M5T5M0_9RHOB|nr:HlyD family type I secretion periplasmic adaptor subunit [Cognatiyoonia sediminum]SHH45988.1 membrane fusion protein, adhesin transport system [Cognatiyoonia sediminum]
MAGSDWELREFAQGPDAARLGKTSWALTLALLVLLVAVCSFVAWASWARIEEVARADGVVVPSGRARGVESLEGGIVRAISVSEGDTVSAGDEIVRIDDTSAAASLGELEARGTSLAARALRLEAELAGADTVDFSSLGLAADDPVALREVALFDSRRAADLSQTTVLETQATQRRQEIEEITNAISRVDESLALLDEEIQLRSDSGVVPRAQIIPIERERTVKRQERDGLSGRLAQATSALAEAEARIEELRLNRRADINSERADALAEVSVIEESLKRASDVVERTSLRAPVDGIVSVLNVNTLGSVVAPGEEVARIVPEGDLLEVEARLRPEDIAFIREDLPARVKLTAFDFTIYGALDGRVVRIGADAEQDEATGTTYFPIIVETEANTLERDGELHQIKPGMVASVDILTGERTVLDYILKPLRKAQYEALRER